MRRAYNHTALLIDVLSSVNEGDSTYVRSTPGSPKNEGSMVTKHLDSDLLSVEPPNGKHSQINGSSLSKGSSNASEEERQALYLRPEDRSLTAKKDNANDAKILFVFPPEPVNTFKMKE